VFCMDLISKKLRLVQYTALGDRFYAEESVFTARYELNLHI
jgi:hypothetical protein